MLFYVTCICIWILKNQREYLERLTDAEVTTHYSKFDNRKTKTLFAKWWNVKSREVFKSLQWCLLIHDLIVSPTINANNSHFLMRLIPSMIQYNMQRTLDISRYISSKRLRKGVTMLTYKGEIWSVFSEFEQIWRYHSFLLSSISCYIRSRCIENPK